MEKTINTLIERGYPHKAAEIVARQLFDLSGQLKEAADEWIATGKEITIASNGYSTNALMERFKGMTYPAALLTIDWLEHDPVKASDAIERGIK